MKNILKIFDFDGTLIDSLEPEIGKKQYLEKSGKEYPHEGWWGKSESLNIDYLDIKPIEPVLEYYKNYSINDKDHLYLITGRLVKLEKEVKRILEANGLEFTEIILNSSGKPTEFYKLDVFKRLISEGSFDEIHIYEDREKHIELFLEYFKSTNIPFVFNKVVKDGSNFIIEVLKHGVL